MALQVNLIKREILAGEDAGQEKVFGQVNVKDVISQELCKRVSVLTCATRGDVELALNGMLLVMKRHLERGDTIRLGSVGLMRMTAGSKGADDEESFTTSLMKKARIQFRPGKALKEVIAHAKFKRMNIRVEQDSCARPHAG